MKICKIINGKQVVKNCQKEDWKAMYAQGWKVYTEEKKEEVRKVEKTEEEQETFRYKRGRE